MYSVEFEEIMELQERGDWAALANRMTDAALRLRAAGADFIVICTNTMHIVADDVRERAGVDLLHIADAAGEEIKARGLTRVGLPGTKFTMQNDFYKKRLDHFGIEAIVPGDEDQEEIHRIIFDELCVGLIKQSSRERLKKVITSLSAQGAQGVVLGCTEIPLIISQEDSPIPVFDTTRIHALAAVKWALEDI